MMSKKLTPKMTVKQFKNAYWYAADLKAFAKSIGIQSANALRKDEIEKLIIKFLKNGKIAQSKRNQSKTGRRDIEKDLSLGLRIVNYTSNAETKEFLLREARKMDAELPKKSGVRYWLNRWREEQMGRGRKITYGDLVKQFVKLSRTHQAFPQIPSTRFNNFISDFLKVEKNASKADAMKAWERLKKLDLPKNYKSWVRFQARKKTG